MAELIPRYFEEELQRLPSKAEAEVYRACRAHLGAPYLVLHGVEWIVRHEDREARDGEADFLICSPAGLLIVEVKGGGVAFDPISDRWSSIDRIGVRHAIKDPFRQAQQEKFAILGKLREHPRWASLQPGRIVIGHAVLFPDLGDVAQLHSPKSPREIVGSQADLKQIDRWVERVFDYWRGEGHAAGELSARSLDLIKEVFAKTVEVRPLLSQLLAEEEIHRVRLTDQQAQILAVLRRHRRAAICGGAGTGKTMLALEKARRAAREGFRTLLLCYNRPLADYLAHLCQHQPGLDVMGFHQLCSIHVQAAGRASGRNLFAEAAAAYPQTDVYDVQWPLALAYATEILPDRYDAIVVDEGQDFRQEFWLPAELLLTNEQTSPLYIFYDQNQALYTQAATFPIKDEPFVLTTNCRNTQPIHQATYRFFQGEDTRHSDLPGRPVEGLFAPSFPAQARKIHALISHLLTVEKVMTGDIVVLMVDANFKQEMMSCLEAKPLPAGIKWAFQEHGLPSTLLVETVPRFKGLESSVVILWGLDTLYREANRELFYVGLSRAKSVLYVASTEDTYLQLTSSTCK